LQFYSDYSSVRISPARTNAANAHRVEAKELGDDGKKKEKKTTDKLKEVAGKAITAISMARGTDVDTNERLTARVINQLQTIFMLLHWNEENGPPATTSTTADTKGPVTPTTITATGLDAANKDNGGSMRVGQHRRQYCRSRRGR
jgi:hypothetical protein